MTADNLGCFGICSLMFPIFKNSFKKWLRRASGDFWTICTWSDRSERFLMIADSHGCLLMIPNIIRKSSTIVQITDIFQNRWRSSAIIQNHPGSSESLLNRPKSPSSSSRPPQLCATDHELKKKNVDRNKGTFCNVVQGCRVLAKGQAH